MNKSFFVIKLSKKKVREGTPLSPLVYLQIEKKPEIPKNRKLLITFEKITFTSKF